MLFRASLLLLLTASVANANPWARDSDGTFIAITEDFGGSTTALDRTTVYVESEVGPERLSIGISGTVGEGDDQWNTFAFVRRPLSSASARDQISLLAGLGAQNTDTGPTEPVLILGGAWDRNVDGALNGWLSLEGEARYLTDSGETELQGDAIVGIEPVDRIALVNEFSLSGVAGSQDDPDAQLTSSIVGSISDRARVQLGATMDLSGDTATGFRVGTWLEF